MRRDEHVREALQQLELPGGSAQGQWAPSAHAHAYLKLRASKHAGTSTCCVSFYVIGLPHLSQTLKPSLRWAMRQSLKNSEPAQRQPLRYSCTAGEHHSRALEGHQCCPLQEDNAH